MPIQDTDSDKTGRLALMEMMVASAVTADSTYQVNDDGYVPTGEIKNQCQSR